MTLAVRAWIALVVLVVVMGLVLFVVAGSARYGQAWAYLAVFGGVSALLTLQLVKHDRALLGRRMRGGPTAERRQAQKLIMLGTSIGFVALLVVPAIDHRFGWSRVPIGLVYLAATPLAMGSFWGLIPIAAILPLLLWRLLVVSLRASRRAPVCRARSRICCTAAVSVAERSAWSDARRQPTKPSGRISTAPSRSIP
jgi:hypothetical protein